jgi:hypothetical protein
MSGPRRPRRCRICKKRPAWNGKNCPPGICKRCYHRHIWPERPAAREQRRASADEFDTFSADEPLDHVGL